jgi:GH24 family phage-related lysozyme (muramidase)
MRPLRVILTLTYLCAVLVSSAQGTVRPRTSRLYSLPPFERAVLVIKYYEGWHTAKHHPYIGYGHQLRPTDRLTWRLSRQQADSLLRADLRDYCALFRRYGKDSLLLAALAYNVGPYKLLGNSTLPKSRLLKMIERGDRGFAKEYLRYCYVDGVYYPSIRRRRWTELRVLGY